MDFKPYLWGVFVANVLFLVGFIAWEQEYKYTLPTPKPAHFKNINPGDKVSLDFLVERDSPQNTYIHFYNFQCPCSRFNIKEFQSIVRHYAGQVNFIAVLQTEDESKEALQRFERKYGLGIMTIHDKQGEIAQALVSCQPSNNVQSGVSFAGSLRCKKTYVAMAMRVFCALTSHKIYDRLTRHLRLDMTLGVYSTPQAVILKKDTIFYKGNYNKARFCLSKNTKFAELALKALVNNEELPSFPTAAEIAYGCELPSNSSPKNRFFNLF